MFLLFPPHVSINSTSEEVRSGILRCSNNQPVLMFPLIQLPRKSEEGLVFCNPHTRRVSINSTSEEVRSVLSAQKTEDGYKVSINSTSEEVRSGWELLAMLAVTLQVVSINSTSEEVRSENFD